MKMNRNVSFKFSRMERVLSEIATVIGADLPLIWIDKTKKRLLIDGNTFWDDLFNRKSDRKFEVNFSDIDHILLQKQAGDKGSWYEISVVLVSGKKLQIPIPRSVRTFTYDIDNKTVVQIDDGSEEPYTQTSKLSHKDREPDLLFQIVGKKIGCEVILQ